MISEWFVEAANHTSGSFDPDVDELNLAGFTPVPSKKVCLCSTQYLQFCLQALRNDTRFEIALPEMYCGRASTHKREEEDCYKFCRVLCSAAGIHACPHAVTTTDLPMKIEHQLSWTISESLAPCAPLIHCLQQ